MYLTELDKKTGLIFISKENDGVLAIREFRNLILDDKLGLKAFTAVALSVDHLSSLRHYDENDRPKAAMEEVTGDRKAFVWDQDKIQAALKKYDALQYDPVIEEGKIHYQRKIRKLKEFSEAEKKYNLRDEAGEILHKGIRDPHLISKELRLINQDISTFEDQIQGKDIFTGSPVKNGYSLTRLEQKLEKKNSFYSSIR